MNTTINIYEKYIIPTIVDARPGDKLLFVSPSACFGFYSLGISNYVTVCNVLKEAAKKNVNLKVITNIHDPLSARASSGLLSFLKDGDQIRNWAFDAHVYYIAKIAKDYSNAIYFEFESEEPIDIKYLDGVKAIPYRAVKNKKKNIDDGDEIRNIEGQFNKLWSSSKRLKSEPYRYDVDQKRMRSILVWKSVSYMLAFLLGMVVSFTLIKDLSNHSVLKTILTVATTSTVFGVSSSIIGTVLIRKFRF